MPLQHFLGHTTSLVNKCMDFPVEDSYVTCLNLQRIFVTKAQENLSVFCKGSSVDVCWN